MSLPGVFIAGIVRDLRGKAGRYVTDTRFARQWSPTLPGSTSRSLSDHEADPYLRLG
jgi:hypothetical protein